MFTRPFRLGLVRLEDRNAPSSIGGNAVATTEWMSFPLDDTLPGYSVGQFSDPNSGTNPNAVQPANQKPVIQNFTVTVDFGLAGKFTGKVVDEHPGGLTVTLTGPQGCLSGGGKTVTTDANGNFEFSGPLTAGLDCGVVTANTSDAQGLAADPAEYDLTV